MKRTLHFLSFCVTISIASWIGLATDSFAQEAVGEKAPAESADGEPPAEAEEVEEDPLALPKDANAEQLFQFIQRTKATRGRTLEEVLKSAKAVVKATEVIRGLDDASEAEQLRAVKEALGTLKFISRYDQEGREKLSGLIESLGKDDRPAFQRIGQSEAFSLKIAELRGASAEQIQRVVADYKELVGEESFSRDLYSLGSSLARAISDPQHAEIAAGLYEYLAEKMATSDDQMLASRAVKMEGAARRVRLPGNEIEIVCPTADGDPLDWDSYRGKVVLVDFWASWCGPCRAEIPNMKRNLEAYDGAFEIVGVNLDRNKEAMNKYVEENNLTWTNLISDDESTMGWDNPMATYYGIMAIPTAILVDQKGRVVSMRARGAQLDRLLLEMLGEPKAPEAEEADPSTNEDGEETSPE